MEFVVLITLLTLLPEYAAETCQIDNCAVCNGNSVCGTCSDGYYLESGSCVRCPIQCSHCTHTSVCQSCSRSFWNPGGGCTSPCSTDCYRGTCDDNGYCYECAPGKYGRRCEQDCALCINGECDLEKCTNGCIDGYLQYDIGSGYSYCYLCPPNCIKCSNTTYCTQCEQGFYGSYYRNPTNGRGNMLCAQCLEDCTQCTSIDQCPQCNTECIKGCNGPGSCTTPSTTHTPSRSSTIHVTTKVVPTTTNHKTPTRTFRLATTEVIKQATIHATACLDECMYICKVNGKCHDTPNYNSDGLSGKCADNNFNEVFGYGIAAGIGITVVVGVLIGFGVYLTRRTKRTKPSADSHEYVNTQMHAITQPSSSEYDVVEANSEIRVGIADEEVDAEREYTSLGERQPDNLTYSDLQ